MQVTLVMEPVPKECISRTLQTGFEDVTPSESSEAESSTASSVPEDDEEAWESGSVFSSFTRIALHVIRTRHVTQICGAAQVLRNMLFSCEFVFNLVRTNIRNDVYLSSYAMKKLLVNLCTYKVQMLGCANRA